MLQVCARNQQTPGADSNYQSAPYAQLLAAFATTASPTCDNAAKVAFDLELKWDARLYVFHVLGIPSRGYSPFVTDVRTGEITEPDPDYIEWVKEEMRNTYDT